MSYTKYRTNILLHTARASKHLSLKLDSRLYDPIIFIIQPHYYIAQNGSSINLILLSPNHRKQVSTTSITLKRDMSSIGLLLLYMCSVYVTTSSAFQVRQ